MKTFEQWRMEQCGCGGGMAGAGGTGGMCGAGSNGGAGGGFGLPMAMPVWSWGGYYTSHEKKRKRRKKHK